MPTVPPPPHRCRHRSALWIRGVPVNVCCAARWFQPVGPKLLALVEGGTR